MTSKECEQQLKELLEAWDLDEACLNQTDINAIKHLLLENQMQHDSITKLRIQISARETVVDELNQTIKILHRLLKIDKDKIDYLVDINERATKETKKQLKRAITQEFTDLKKILNILKGDK